MAKKSLAQQIAEISKPENPDYDIEDSERGVFEHEERSSGDELADQDDDELKSKHYLKVSKSKLRDNSIKLKNPKYVGKPSSRKEIFGEDSDDEQGDSEDSDDLIDDEDDDNLEHENREETSEEEIEQEEQAENDDDNSDESGVSLKADSEDEESEPEQSTDEETITSKRDKLKQLMASERKHVINRLSTATQTDALKGYAVIKQQKFFDSIIDTRIKLQKAVTSSNLLPLNNEIFEEFKEESTEKSLSKVEKSLHSLLNNIILLRTKIYNKEKITKKPLKFKEGKKRSFQQYLQETENLDDVLNNYRDPVLTKWSHKIQSASGATALNASKFKSVNQSAAQQVEANLLDMDRLLKRTRLNRRAVKPLGHLEDELQDDDKNVNTIDRSLKDDENIFDDEDFYRVLLNDLVDKKISESNPVNGLTIQLTKTKLKKNVDTRASKGRKLKYTVQEPIQNWQAPKGKFKWNDEQIDEFFAGLLGQRVNFNEDEQDNESESEKEEYDEEDELLKHDDLKIFG